jgi:hypothetical protein
MDKQRACILGIMMVCMLLIGACGSAAPEGGVSVWIDVPVHRLVVELGTVVQIEGHATGASAVEIWIDGVQLFDVSLGEGGGELSAFNQSWTPITPGEHVIQVVALSADTGFSANDTTNILVQGSQEQPVEEAAPAEATVTPTPTPEEPTVDQVEAAFWADPPSIQAGACTTLRWQVSNAQSVKLGSTEMSAQGEYRVCLCEPQRYTLTVTDLEGQTQSHQVTIEVIGECVTPTPTPTPTPDVDNTPPTAPLNLSPNGGSLGCVANVNLSWSSVSDPSGIAEYQVDAFRHAGDNNWSVAPGSVWTGISGTGMSMPVQCGWTYRWRVRAIDGVGNAGPFSGWATFVVPLT